MSGIDFQQRQEQSLRQVQRPTLSRLLLSNMLAMSDDELEEMVRKNVEEETALDFTDSPDSTDASADASDEDFDENSDFTDETPDDRETEKDSASPASDSFDDYDNWEPAQRNGNERDDEAPVYERTLANSFSFQESLLKQISELALSDEEVAIVQYMIGSLDSSGYLTKTNESLVNDLYVHEDLRTTEEKVEYLRTHVLHTLEPAGVGATDLQECLLIQLKTLRDNLGSSSQLETAVRIIQDHFDAFLDRKEAKIRQALGITPEMMEEAREIIRKLQIYPSSSFGGTEYVVPDFIITIEDGKLQLSLVNEFSSRIRVNDESRRLLDKMRAKRDEKACDFIKKSINKAELFIYTISERDRTMYLVMKTIMDYQSAYFLSGNIKDLKPMVQRNIADKVQMDVSTISRVTSSRYVRTPYGMICLKDLFSERPNQQSDVSNKVVKDALAEIIRNEKPQAPFTDEALVAELKKRKMPISRRTVVKYRTELNIPNSNLRKQSE